MGGGTGTLIDRSVILPPLTLPPTHNTHRPGGVLRVSWVDSRFLDGRGLTTATLSVPIVRAHLLLLQSDRSSKTPSRSHTHSLSPTHP